ERADPETRRYVYTWITQAGEEIIARDTGGLLRWTKTLKPSTDPSKWKLSDVSQAGNGSCLGLVSAAVVVGRSIGVNAFPVAAPDHAILGIRENGRVRFFELADGSEVSSAELFMRYHLTPGSSRAFLRALSDKELLACVRVERGAEFYERGEMADAASDFRR